MLLPFLARRMFTKGLRKTDQNIQKPKGTKKLKTLVLKRRWSLKNLLVSPDATIKRRSISTCLISQTLCRIRRKISSSKSMATITTKSFSIELKRNRFPSISGTTGLSRSLATHLSKENSIVSAKSCVSETVKLGK